MSKLSLDDVRLGDVVRLRNGETFAVATKCESYGDRDGEYPGPWLSPDRAFRSHYLLADVVEVVLRNPRVCAICGSEGITSKSDECDFCVHCFYSGAMYARAHASLLAKLDALDVVESAHFWHTGGGCFLLAIKRVDGRLLTCTELDAGVPEPGDPWLLIVEWSSEDAYDEFDYESTVEHDDVSLSDDELVAWVEAQS